METFFHTHPNLGLKHIVSTVAVPHFSLEDTEAKSSEMLSVIQLVLCVISVTSMELGDDLRAFDLRNEVQLGELWIDYKEMHNKSYSTLEENFR